MVTRGAVIEGAETNQEQVVYQEPDALRWASRPSEVRYYGLPLVAKAHVVANVQIQPLQTIFLYRQTSIHSFNFSMMQYKIVFNLQEVWIYVTESHRSGLRGFLGHGFVRSN